ncbi:MAG TPA: family 43 glycosylhydrolase [Solirubrobacteraceae bacterium]
MALRLVDKWVWDFWFAKAAEEHHVFYLQAPRALARPALRHHHASIGHAVSRDLRTWRVLADALEPGPSGSWDDLATWTGSVLEHDGRWYMLYTGISRREQGLIQRIGLAISDDLVSWSKHPGNPVLEADPRWYDLLDLRRWRDQSWRDPWLFRHPADGSLHCLITARSSLGTADGAGVVAHARSLDMIDWEVLPPVTTPGDFAQVEVPQLVRMHGRYVILVSCQAEDHSRARIERLGGAAAQTGTFVFASDGLFGDYECPNGPIANPDGPLGPLYAGKLLEREAGTWEFMAFRGDGDHDFLGELTDPLAVVCDAEGQLAVCPATAAGAER